MRWVSMSHKEVKIRKPHKCYGCCRIFTPGDQMIYWAGITDGTWVSGYRCRTCDEIMGLIDHNDEGYGFGFALDGCDPGETVNDLLTRLKKEQYEIRQKKQKAGLVY